MKNSLNSQTLVNKSALSNKNLSENTNENTIHLNYETNTQIEEKSRVDNTSKISQGGNQLLQDQKFMQSAAATTELIKKHVNMEKNLPVAVHEKTGGANSEL